MTKACFAQAQSCLLREYIREIEELPYGTYHQSWAEQRLMKTLPAALAAIRDCSGHEPNASQLAAKYRALDQIEVLTLVATSHWEAVRQRVIDLESEEADALAKECGELGITVQPGELN